jgi:ACS family glucarate transporter-like MFS transporter
MSARAASHVRYGIIAILFLVTTVNYASRAAISIAGAPLADEFHLSAAKLGFIFSGFAWAYVLCQLPGGALLDRFGSRTVYLWSIALWSIFTAAQAFVGGLTVIPVFISLFLLRLFLGASESPAFPANARIVANWFPDSERGTASAIFNSAQYFSLVVFGPLLGFLTQRYGWRTAMLAMGAAGAVSALVFAWGVFSPRRHRRISRAEYDHIAANGALVKMEGEGSARPPAPWRMLPRLLSNRMLLGIFLGQYCVNALTYFFVTWFPVYLIRARHLSVLEAGLASAGPAICGWLGGILGGVISDWLLRRGASLSLARKLPIVAGFLVSTVILLCNFTQSQGLVLLFMSLGFFGKGVGALGWAVLSDVAPPEATGLSGSLFNMIGNAAGIVTPLIIGYIVSATGSFAIALWFLAGHSLLAVFSFTVIAGPIRRFVLQPARETSP